MENLRYKFEIFKNGFTLAEVLITLVIIGVVAAMTIPNIIYETKKHEYSARLKKFYSTMKQVQQKAAADGKSWTDWAHSASGDDRGLENVLEFQRDYLLPYLSYSKTEANTETSKVYLNDGSSFKNFKGDCIDFYFDVNGDKMPNQYGKDVFIFLFCPLDALFRDVANTFSPYQEYQYDRGYAMIKCSHEPQYCSSLLMIDGWEFKSDYPHRL